MIVYRLAKTKYASDLSGTGAALYPGRWNKKGTPVLYTGESKEIALLETVVNLPPAIAPQLDLVTLDIPDDSITVFEAHFLPFNWFHYPAPTILSDLGQTWIDEGKTIALKVPSAIIDTAYNIVLNCAHKDYKRIRVVDQSPFRFDTRLVR